MPRRSTLEALLRSYAPADGTEQVHLVRMLALLEVAGDPFARSHFAPGHFTASGFVLSPNGYKLLLIHHRKLGRWLQPGGHIDTDDVDVVAAARRELCEEVGLSDPSLAIEGIFDLDIHAIPELGAEPCHEHFDVRFAFRAPTEEIHAGSDAKSARWVSLAEIDGAQSDSSVMRAVRKLRIGA